MNKTTKATAEVYHKLRSACQAAFDELAADNTNQSLIDQLDEALSAHMKLTKGEYLPPLLRPVTKLPNADQDPSVIES